MAKRAISEVTGPLMYSARILGDARPICRIESPAYAAPARPPELAALGPVHDLGPELPVELSVVGFDDIPEASRYRSWRRGRSLVIVPPGSSKERGGGCGASGRLVVRGILYQAGMVGRRKQGNAVRYALVDWTGWWLIEPGEPGAAPSS